MHVCAISTAYTHLDRSDKYVHRQPLVVCAPVPLLRHIAGEWLQNAEYMRYQHRHFDQVKNYAAYSQLHP